MKQNNFKIECTQDCYGIFDILLYKKGKTYTFVNGFCINETGSESMEYTSFDNFIYFNGGWKNNFVKIDK
jgi:hypothetical protein